MTVAVGSLGFRVMSWWHRTWGKEDHWLGLENNHSEWEYWVGHSIV